MWSTDKEKGFRGHGPEPCNRLVELGGIIFAPLHFAIKPGYKRLREFPVICDGQTDDLTVGYSRKICNTKKAYHIGGVASSEVLGEIFSFWYNFECTY